jgi:hypothetical protein
MLPVEAMFTQLKSETIASDRRLLVSNSYTRVRAKHDGLSNEAVVVRSSQDQGACPLMIATLALLINES